MLWLRLRTNSIKGRYYMFKNKAHFGYKTRRVTLQEIIPLIPLNPIGVTQRRALRI